YELQYFDEMLAAGAVDVLQADATRCCGITGFLKASALCESRSIPLSAHCAPSLHAQLGCALLPLGHLEYFFDHARIESMLLDGNRGGFFAIQPAVPFKTERRYVEATNVLETTFIAEAGRVKVLDLMPALAEESKRRVLLPSRELLRRVECIEGEVPMSVTY